MYRRFIDRSRLPPRSWRKKEQCEYEQFRKEFSFYQDQKKSDAALSASPTIPRSQQTMCTEDYRLKYAKGRAISDSVFVYLPLLSNYFLNRLLIATNRTAPSREAKQHRGWE